MSLLEGSNPSPSASPNESGRTDRRFAPARSGPDAAERRRPRRRELACAARAGLGDARRVGRAGDAGPDQAGVDGRGGRGARVPGPVHDRRQPRDPRRRRPRAGGQRARRRRRHRAGAGLLGRGADDRRRGARHRRSRDRRLRARQRRARGARLPGLQHRDRAPGRDEDVAGRRSTGRPSSATSR